MLVDTHAHLDFGDFDHDRDEVVARALDAGVVCIIDPGCDVATSRRAVELADTYDTVYAAVGIHPNSTAAAAPGDLMEIARLAKHPKVVAVGETGLDFYRDRSPREVQVRAFCAQLELARECGLPVIVHFRNVEEEGIGLVGGDAFKGLRGVFHCFGGSRDFAMRVLDLGFYIGFDGPLTYKNSDRVKVAQAVPLERCLIETDAPFLTPQKHRGCRNEPAYVTEVAGKLAEIHGCSRDEVAAVTGRNTRALFGIGP